MYNVMTSNTILSQWVSAFLLDRTAQNLSPRTVRYYKMNLSQFAEYCIGQGIQAVTQLEADMIRRYLLYLEASHNSGGVHGHFRALRSFLLWYEMEDAPQGWTNPITRVKAPRLVENQLEPVALDAVKRMVKRCPHDMAGMRDKAIMLFLLDTGARASEACDMDLADCNLITGEAIIRKGKGSKLRRVYLGEHARRAMRIYTRMRDDNDPALFVGRHGRLTYSGMSQLIERRAVAAGIVPRPTPHSFRRAFALACLRSGMDVYALQKLMGHEDLQTLKRYIKLTETDLEAAHRRASPVDNWKL